jgi:serpin B
MLHAGAQGETAEQISRVLGFPPAPHFYSQAGALMRQIRDNKSPSWKIVAENNLWLQLGFRVNASFEQLLRRDFGSCVDLVDFQGNVEEARAAINRRIAERTDGDISELLDRSSLDAATRLVLTNLLVFRGEWEHKFNPKGTRTLKFYVAPQRTVPTPMMSQSGTFRFLSTETADLVELPYVEGKGSMLLIAPKQPDGLPAIEESLSWPLIEKWRQQMQEQDVIVLLPRFRTSVKLALAEPLKRMGMRLPFSAQADFSGIHQGAPLQLSQVVQQISVDVDELGTAAKAASAAVVNLRTLKAVFRADRPFVLFVLDDRTNAILVMGRIANPLTAE